MDVKVGKEEMETVGAIWGALGAICGTLLGVFVAGRRTQKELARIDALETAVKEVKDSVAELKKLFVTENGDPRLITVTVCGAKQSACDSTREAQHSAIVHTLEQQDKKLDKILDHFLRL